MDEINALCQLEPTLNHYYNIFNELVDVLNFNDFKFIK